MLRCLIQGCESNKENNTLFSFPRPRTMMNIWCKLVAPYHSKHLKPPHEWVRPQANKGWKVCALHFEDKYLMSKGDRIVRKPISIPTLFTPDEIKSGRPKFAITLFDGQYLNEHNYTPNSKAGHDHTYACNAKNDIKLHRVADDASVSYPTTSHERLAVGAQDKDKVADDSSVSYLTTSHERLAVGARDKDECINEDNGIDSNYGIDPEDEPSEGIFSWQKEEILYPTEDTDVLCPKKADAVELKQELGDLTLYDEDSHPGAQRDPNLDKHAEYQCNVCQKEIIGFRYTCVQCADWDLCGACEARAAHATHYVLRVPGPRPYNEIQTVLTAIRQQLLSENLFLSEQITEDRVKSEPEDEAPAAGRDPLQPLLSGSEDAQTDGSEYSPPRRKRRRRRHRSSDADDSSDSDTVPDDSSIYSGSSSIPNKPEHLLNQRQPNRLTSSTVNTINTRRKPVTRSESIQPILEQPNFKNQGEQPEDNVSKIPGTTWEVPGDAIEVPGCLLQVPSDLFEYPSIFQISGDILQVPDDVTVYIEEMSSLDALNINPLNNRMEEVVDSNLEGSNQIMHLRVPPDTNDNALAQALQSQAYVTIQPLATEELRAAKR